MYTAALGRRIRALREEKGLLQQAVAKRSGLSRRFIGQIERGDGNVSFARLNELCEALNVSLVTVVVGLGPAFDPLARVTEAVSRLQEKEINALLQRMVKTRNKVSLVGLRGAGKTTIGEALSSRFGWAFRRLDEHLEDRTGMALSELFEYFGPEHYRELCRETLEYLLDTSDPLVLEVGGSLVLDPASYALLKLNTLVVWLRASPEEHLQRVEAQGDTRPMMGHSNALDLIRAILAQRKPLYSEANLVIHTDELGLKRSILAIENAVGMG